MSLSDDADIIMSDLMGLGFATIGTYAHGATTVPNIRCVFEINNADQIEAITGQNQNEAAAVTVSYTDLPTWSYGGRITVASGPWAGVWTISAHIGSDDRTTTLSVTKQKAVKTRSPGVEKLIGGE